MGKGQGLVPFSCIVVSNDLVLVEINIPNSLPIETIDVATLDTDWRAYPAPENCSLRGDEWCAALSASVLRVSSAIIQGDNDYNLLLNPTHPAFKKTKFLITLMLPVFDTLLAASRYFCEKPR